LENAGLKHRLARRLGIGGVLIAAILGGLVFWHEMEVIEDSFVEEALGEAKQLAPSLPEHLTPETSARTKGVLKAFLIQRRQGGGDHFIGVEIYDSGRTSVAEAAAAGFEAVDNLIDLSRHVFPKPGDTWYLKHVLDRELFIQVVAPLPGPGGGYFEGVYHISSARMKQATSQGWRSSVLVMLAVLATSGLLYPIIARLNRDLLDGSKALLVANLGAIEMLGSAIAKRDSDTNSHNYRVTLYAVRLAEAAGLPTSSIRSLIKGAFLHDVGKLGIPDAVLLKPGKLDTAEFEVMKTHVHHGLDVVQRFAWLNDAAEVVGCHHEKYDGSGYSEGLAGEEIPVTARIFAIADVFDALTSKRPYKEAFPVARALEILAEGRSRHFDPALLDRFIDLAPGLYREFGGREDDRLEQVLRQITVGYFKDLVGAT